MYIYHSRLFTGRTNLAITQDAERLGINNGKLNILDPWRGRYEFSEQYPELVCGSKEWMEEFKNFFGHPFEYEYDDMLYRDYQDVVSSSLVIVDFSHESAEKASYGVTSEIAWAWQNKVPVIAVLNPGGTLPGFYNHFMLKAALLSIETTRSFVERIRIYDPLLVRD